MTLYRSWLDAKAEEQEAQRRRRDIEDELLDQWGNPTAKGVKNFKDGGYKVKVTFREDTAVDLSLLKELSTEAGLDEHMDALFRWKAEVNKKAWNAASENITGPLSGAITTKPGRPSFAVEVVEEADELEIY